MYGISGLEMPLPCDCSRYQFSQRVFYMTMDPRQTSDRDITRDARTATPGNFRCRVQGGAHSKNAAYIGCSAAISVASIFYRPMTTTSAGHSPFPDITEPLTVILTMNHNHNTNANRGKQMHRDITGNKTRSHCYRHHRKIAAGK